MFHCCLFLYIHIPYAFDFRRESVTWRFLTGKCIFRGADQSIVSYTYAPYAVSVPSGPEEMGLGTKNPSAIFPFCA